MNKKNSNFKSILFYIVVIALMIGLSTYLLNGMNKQKELVYSDVVDMFHEGQVKEFVVTNDNVLNITKTDNTEVSYTLRSVDMFWEDLGTLIDQQYSAEDGNLERYHFEAQTEIPWWVSFLPYIIIIAAVIIMYVVMMNQAMGKGGKINS
ncbi:MAG: ATP-dependent metallopeptidase FtsH/Yme1/Tma family protein, partial [Clostridia bacterium]|nr:ATP-dependent metallopeptidase FtsH/Yme1/Tma family protein [Clostridia bacterium]